MSENKITFPFVSVCTPTFNRRPFIPALIQCFKNQNYPKDRIEWIVVDDGTDPVRDLFIDIECVKYYYFKDRMILGKKRNIMHSKCSGDIIIYMDDDDYYPDERISHAVETLETNKQFLMAGSSEMHLYFHDLNKMVQCGPYAHNHSTAATFAFRKELLLETSYDESKALAEEKHFLKDYKIPVKQLDTLKTILVIAHSHNSYDKKLLLETPESCLITASKYKIDDFIKDNELLQFYTKDIHLLLECYSLGSPSYKPEILQQMEKTKIERAKRIERAKQ
jgi:glycosyltransferase involved in cell wall biosynthesis